MKYTVCDYDQIRRITCAENENKTTNVHRGNAPTAVMGIVWEFCDFRYHLFEILKRKILLLYSKYKIMILINIQIDNVSFILAPGFILTICLHQP